jgi:hypothetical protein
MRLLVNADFHLSPMLVRAKAALVLWVGKRDATELDLPAA